MHNSDYYREQAVYYRQLAAAAETPAAKQEFLELAEACEEAADRMDDCRASGWSDLSIAEGLGQSWIEAIVAMGVGRKGVES